MGSRQQKYIFVVSPFFRLTIRAVVKGDSLCVRGKFMIWRDRKFYKHFIEGLSAMIDRILPSNIVFYGKIPQYDFGEIMVKQYTPDTFFWKNKAREVYYRTE